MRPFSPRRTHLVTQRHHHRGDVLAVSGWTPPTRTRATRLPGVRLFAVRRSRDVRVLGGAHRDLAFDRMLFLFEFLDRLAPRVEATAQERIAAGHPLNRPVAHRRELFADGRRGLTPGRRNFLRNRFGSDFLVCRFLDRSVSHRMTLEASGTYTELGAMRLFPERRRCSIYRGSRCRPQAPLSCDLTHPPQDCNSKPQSRANRASRRLGPGPRATGATGFRSRKPKAGERPGSRRCGAGAGTRRRPETRPNCTPQ